jgi:ribonuclease P/MRP protein subunit POP5
MKVLPPTLREKKRYIIFEVCCKEKIESKELIKEILSSTRSLYGDLGMSKFNLWLISFDGRSCIIRCARDKTEDVRAALAAIDRINDQSIGISVLGISGTINGAKKRLH